MVRHILVLVTCLAVLFPAASVVPAAAAPPYQQSPTTGVVTTRSLNVRSSASTTASVIAKLKQGDKVGVIGQNTDATWLNVRLSDGRQGWVSAQYIRLPLTASASAAAPAKQAGAIPSGAVPAQLVGVTDGDTIDVTIDGRPDTVRYIGIDTPERDQPGYKAASDANRTLLGAGALYLVADTSDRDRYGRLLRYVYLPDGRMVNRELVAQGWAQPVEYPPDTRFARDFRAAASQAAKAKRGFWAGTGSDGAMPYALTTGSANIRKGPGKSFLANSTVPAGTSLTVYGRTPAGDWLQVRAPDRSGGWVSAGLVALAVAANQVPVAKDIPQATAAPAAPPAASRSAPVPQPAAPQAPAPAPSGGTVQIVELNGTAQDETVVVQNLGTGPVDISGWRIQSYGGKTCQPVADQVYTFPGGIVLQPGASVRVHSAGGGIAAPPSDLLWTNDNIWNNSGDRADLIDAAGQVVSTAAYGNCG